MTDHNPLFLDSDFYVGLYRKNDAHHERAVNFVKSFKELKITNMYTSNLVIGETMTVLSHKSGQDMVRRFYDNIHNNITNLFFVDEEIDKTAKEIFIGQETKGTSYVDCTNVAVMRAYGIEQIFSFDKVYHKKFGMTNLAYPEEKVA